ncbi:MAG: hypothetical protein LUC33_07195 [Prevotellaceae bacterium]|nr:hypothetical protein [Prevotellaceae bacterium]
MTIAVDFDGTIVREAYPEIGREIPFAVDTLRRLAEEGHHLLLWTVREGELLEEAVDWCRKRGLEFYAVNSNFPGEQPDESRHYSRKLRVDLFIDDRNLGGLPDWGVIYKMIAERKTVEEVLVERLGAEGIRKRRKHWWKP